MQEFFLVLLAIGAVFALFMVLPRVALIIVRSGSLPLQMRMEGPGFLSPFYFRASHVRFEWDDPRSDRILLRCARIRFRISILALLRLRLRVLGLRVDDLYLEYENRTDSFQKTALLPLRGRVVFESLNVSSGEVVLIDHILPGPYRLRLRQIQIENGRFDVATSTDLLFGIHRGRALLGKGLILMRTNGNTGTILIRNVDWNSVMGMEGLPYLSDLPGASFSMFIRHESLSGERTAVQGSLHLLGSNAEKDRELEGGIPFAFEIQWDQYRMTTDLGIQKLIDEILQHARPGLIERGFLLVGKGLFERIKKSSGSNTGRLPPKP